MALIQTNPALFISVGTSDTNIVVGSAIAINSSGNAIRADASDPNKMPVVGFARSISTNKCIIQMDHVITISSSVTPGATYWADPSTPGGVTPNLPTSSGSTVQKVAIGKSSNSLIIRIDTLTVEL